MKLPTLSSCLLVFALVAACGGPDAPLAVETDALMAPPQEGAAPPAPTTTSTATIDWEAIYEVLLDSVWESACESLDFIRQVGVATFCEAYLDANGYPQAGLRRSIARRICITKVNRAIDDAVCAITDVLTATTAPPGDGG